MRRSAVLMAIVLTLAIAARLTAGGQAASALKIGSPLPRLEGETLSAKKFVLPDAVKGRVGLLVFSFSREAGEAARCWNEAFTKVGVADTAATSIGIMMLSDVPWLLRGLVAGGIKRGVPASLHDRTVKVFADDDAWRAGLSVKSAGTPYLVLVDRASHARWLHAGLCDTANEQRMREQVKILLAATFSSQR